jgi:hypothetical protein
VWVAEEIVEYGEGLVNLIGVVEFADGKITKADLPFANPLRATRVSTRWAEHTAWSG